MTDMPHAEPILVLCTWPADGDPREAAAALVGERLAACVSILPPMESIYRWKGAVERAEERQLLIKTTRGQAEALLLRLGQLHPYDVPEALVVPIVGGSPAYRSWLAQSVGG
jgi:periplasmic divalent cation tolerance protein